MNRALVNNWNRLVNPRDEVYILGDLTMKGPALAMEILSQLKGRKYLIRGNHDAFVEHKEFDLSAEYNFNNLEKGIRRFDVGVDANYMKPVSIEDIIAFFSL